MGTHTRSGEHDKIEGIEHLDKIIDIDQSPIGRTPSLIQLLTLKY